MGLSQFVKLKDQSLFLNNGHPWLIREREAHKIENREVTKEEKSYDVYLLALCFRTFK